MDLLRVEFVTFLWLRGSVVVSWPAGWLAEDRLCVSDYHGARLWTTLN
jgi:hypothetical protein